MANPTHLVVVCGHGTFRGSGEVWQESSWILESFRKGNPDTRKPSEHYTFIQHILCGAAILDQDPEALLVFSGGCTQDEVPTTEARSYQQAFEQLRGPENLERTTCEALATDSYQNLLFSVFQFYKVTKTWPEQITVITHAFKERRFLNCHATAIRWPAQRIRTIGINPAFTLAELNQVHWGENESAFKHFVTDPYGSRSPLSEKRIKRGWNTGHLTSYIEFIDGEERRLALWTGGVNGQDLFEGSLAWC